MWKKWSLIIVFLLTWGCFQENFYEKIQKLKAEGQFLEAKKLYEIHLAGNQDKAIERQYIQFLFTQNFFLDFNVAAQKYLRENPDDYAIKNLMFRYYARLADDAERQGDYDQALTYIIGNLLSTDFEDYKTWELRQSTVLRKWYDSEKNKENNLLGRKLVMSKMVTLGLHNLAKSVDPELYQEMESDTGQ